MVAHNATLDAHSLPIYSRHMVKTGKPKPTPTERSRVRRQKLAEERERMAKALVGVVMADSMEQARTLACEALRWSVVPDRAPS